MTADSGLAPLHDVKPADYLSTIIGMADNIEAQTRRKAEERAAAEAAELALIRAFWKPVSDVVDAYVDAELEACAVTRVQYPEDENPYFVCKGEPTYFLRRWPDDTVDMTSVDARESSPRALVPAVLVILARAEVRRRAAVAKQNEPTEPPQVYSEHNSAQ
jgi:hypothetical protein